MNIDILNEYVQTIENSAHYWMVRTMGGKYYHTFTDKHFIAIGHNDILLREIKGSYNDTRRNHPRLRDLVKGRYPDVPRPGHIASQLFRFCHNIKVGDIVVVPGHSSFEISVCKVTGEVYEDAEAEKGEDGCDFMKRIPVRILRRVKRNSLPYKAQLMFNSRHPISDITEYSMYIDNTCLDYYSKEDETHIVLRIKTADEVPAPTFYNINKILVLAEQFCADNDIDGKATDVIMKVQMESPGILRFISKKKNYLAIVGLIILFINGGGMKIDKGDFHLDLSTDGIFRNVSEYLDRKTDREIRESIKQSMDSLQIDTPEDFQKAMIQLYETQNANRKKY